MRAIVTIVLGLVFGVSMTAAQAPAPPAPATPVPVPQAEQQRFATPLQAVRALAEAARSNDRARMLAILGPDGETIVSSGDEVEDARARRTFVQSVGQRVVFEELPGGHSVARLGTEDWPLPIPLVKDGTRWRFDTAAGREELVNRRIGRNELTAIAVAREYVEAQLEYARADRGGGRGVFAQRLLSTPGSRDGLYWNDESGRDDSPLGPLVAEAAAEGYTQAGGATPGPPRPYHGYYFRVLTAQGANAPGGAKSYVADGKLTGGFALIAWPAEYGVSGIMTFVVNRQGIVFQKDLGPTTAEAAKGMTAYDPDASWTPAR